jgi:uncharacterized peroxidase-related enzyme
MALLSYPDDADLPDQVRAEIQSFEEAHGRASLLRRMMAWFPPLLTAAEHIYEPCYGNGRLPRELKELLFVAASHERGCHYCAGGHSRFLVAEYGYQREDVEALREGKPVDGVTEADLALIEFVRKATREPHKTVEADITKLRHLGWDTPEIVEALATCMIAAFTNTMALTLHLEDDIADELYF